MALMQLSSIIFLISSSLTEGYIFVLFTLLYPILYFINLYYRLKRYKDSQPWYKNSSNDNIAKEDPKVVLITGASSGIGESLAYEFAKRKAFLILCARRIDVLTNVVGKNCKALGATKVISVKTDVSNEEDVDKLIEIVKTSTAAISVDDSGDENGVGGKLDCLILNAGVSMGETLEDIKNFDLIRQIIDINFFGSTLLTHKAIPLLKKKPSSPSKSRIVVVSSILGFIPAPLRTGYCASKFALKGFFEGLQHELMPYGVFVTMAYPGEVATEVNKNRLGENPKYLEMKNAISSEECARIIFESTCRGDKEVVFTTKGKLARLMEGVFPDLFSNIIYRTSLRILGKEREDGSDRNQKKK